MKKIISIFALALVMSVASVAVVQAECKYRKGQNVDVVWKGKWYDAKILKVTVKKVPVKGDRCHYKIHYNGWSSSWDETVTHSRIRNK